MLFSFTGIVSGEVYNRQGMVSPAIRSMHWYLILLILWEESMGWHPMVTVVAVLLLLLSLPSQCFIEDSLWIHVKLTKQLCNWTKYLTMGIHTLARNQMFTFIIAIGCSGESLGFYMCEAWATGCRSIRQHCSVIICGLTISV